MRRAQPDSVSEGGELGAHGRRHRKSAGGRPHGRRPPRRSLPLGRLDRAALGFAIGLAGHDPALALARILAGAAVAAAAACTLPFAIVAAYALHLGGRTATLTLSSQGLSGD